MLQKFNNVVDLNTVFKNAIAKQCLNLWTKNKILSVYKKANDETEYVLMHFYNNEITNVYGLIEKTTNNDYRFAWFLNDSKWIDNDDVLIWSVIDMDSLYLQFLLEEKIDEVLNNLEFIGVYELFNVNEYKKFDKHFNKNLKRKKAIQNQVIIGDDAINLNDVTYKLFEEFFTNMFCNEFLCFLQSWNVKINDRIQYGEFNNRYEYIDMNLDNWDIDLDLFELDTHIKVFYYGKEFMYVYFNEEWLNNLLDCLEKYQGFSYPNRCKYVFSTDLHEYGHRILHIL